MRRVRDDSGNRYLLVKQSSDASRVRNPKTGEETYINNDKLEFVDKGDNGGHDGDDNSDCNTDAVHDERTLGLLVELDTRGPRSVRTLLSTTDFCESDLHGLLTELRVAGLIEETTIAGERGYKTTETASTAITRYQARDSEPCEPGENDCN